MTCITLLGEIVHKICSGSQFCESVPKCIVLSTELFSTGFAQLRNIYNFSCCVIRRMGCITALQLLKITLLFCISPPFIYGTTEYYVMPTEYHGIPCPGEPCHTLNYYARNIPNYAWSDVVVRFLPGNHSLNQPFHISKKRNLQLISFYPAISVHTGNVTIHCTNEANFHFQHASNVTIVGLLFITELVLCLALRCLTPQSISEYRKSLCKIGKDNQITVVILYIFKIHLGNQQFQTRNSMNLKVQVM